MANPASVVQQVQTVRLPGTSMQTAPGAHGDEPAPEVHNSAAVSGPAS